MPGIYLRDEGNVDRAVTQIFVRDAENVARQVNEVYVRDSSNVSQRVFQMLAQIVSIFPYIDISTSGGDTITVTGRGFTNAIGVRVGSTDVSCVVVSDTQLHFIMPVTSAGTHIVYVVNHAGASNGVPITTKTPTMVIPSYVYSAIQNYTYGGATKQVLGTYWESALYDLSQFSTISGSARTQYRLSTQPKPYGR